MGISDTAAFQKLPAVGHAGVPQNASSAPPSYGFCAATTHMAKMYPDTFTYLRWTRENLR